MTTSRIPIRTAVKTHLVDRIDQAIPDAQVSRVWPAGYLEDDHIYLGNITGTVEFPLAMAGEKIRDDTFTLTIIVVAGAAGRDPVDAEATCERWKGQIIELVAQTLDLNGQIDGLEIIEVGDDNGPDLVATGEGYQAVASLDINVQSRIHPS